MSLSQAPPHDQQSNEGFARVTWVTRRVLRQREVSVTMTGGRYGKNEIILHETGMTPTDDLAKVVEEASRALEVMMSRNPIEIPPSKESKALETQTKKRLEAKPE